MSKPESTFIPWTTEIRANHGYDKAQWMINQFVGIVRRDPHLTLKDHKNFIDPVARTRNTIVTRYISKPRTTFYGYAPKCHQGDETGPETDKVVCEAAGGIWKGSFNNKALKEIRRDVLALKYNDNDCQGYLLNYPPAPFVEKC